MLPHPVYLVALIALVPGIVVWWTGRQISARTSDPALPELLWARQVRTRGVFIAAFSAMIVLAGHDAVWGLPLMWVGATTGGYSLRRSLGIEKANLARQLWRNGKSIAGGLGFWIVLIFTPEIVLSIDAQYRALSLLIIPVLLAWEHWYSRIWLRLHDAEPLTDERLTSRFAEIVARAGIAAPGVYRIGAPDARFMNALALPGIREPAIGLGNALVELLEPEETAAIYAHELSHIEQFSPRKLRRFQLITRSLIVIGVIMPLIVGRMAPAAAPWLPWIWPVILLGALIYRGRGSKDRETESDLRAASLCGDPEVMVRALIKVHVHGFIPRRWDVDFERQASHPSLTRRIQALRGEAAHASTSPHAPILLSTAREGSVVAFDAVRAYWFDGVSAEVPRELDDLRANAGSVRSVAWGELEELRIAIRGDARALHARHRNGDSWSVPLESSHVEAVQKALDVVDVRLRRELGKKPMLDTRLLATLMIVAILWASDLSVMLVPAVIGAIKPSTVMAGALGSMAVASGVFGLVREWSAGDGLAPRFVGLVLIGATSMWIAWYHARRRGKQDGIRLAAITLGGLTTLFVVAIVLTAAELPIRDVVQRPVVAGLALSLVGLATILMFVRVRASRVGAGFAIATAAAAIAPTLIAMNPFGSADRFARDQATATEIARVALGAGAAELSVSPNGDRYLVHEFDDRGEADDDEDEGRAQKSRFTIGTFNGTRRSFSAMQAALIDDSHVLSLERADGALDLRMQGEDSVVVWTSRLPLVRRPVLAVSARDRRWTILGEASASDSLVLISGTQAGGEPVVRRMAFSRATRTGRGVYNMGRAISVGDRIVSPAFDYGKSASNALTMFAFSLPRVDLWETTASGERSVGHFEGMPECATVDERQAICVVRRLREPGQVWTLEQTGPAHYIGRVPIGDMGRIFIGPGARVSGVRMQRDAAVVAIDVAARRMSTIHVPMDSGFVSEARAVPGRLVVLRYENGKATLIAYRVDGL